MNTVVMPTCKRVEMLTLSLEALDKTGKRDLDVRIYADTDTCVDDVEYVRDTYYPEAMIFRAKPHAKVPSGMWNILHALKQGYETGAERVFLIEEDVVVSSKKFFQWHESAQSHNPNLLASLGRRHRPGYELYTNPGSCFSSAALSLIVKHIVPELFLNREAYLDRHFGPMAEVSTLDDGLIRRIQKYYAMDVAIPEAPTCSHIGFHAYRRYMGWENYGTIQERIARLRVMLPTIDKKNRYLGDFEPLLEK